MSKETGQEELKSSNRGLPPVTVTNARSEDDYVERKMSECMTQRFFSAEGNVFWAGGACIGLAMSAFTPAKWSVMKRAAPFLAMGFSGMVLDTVSLCRDCQGNEAELRDQYRTMITGLDTRSPPAAAEAEAATSEK